MHTHTYLVYISEIKFLPSSVPQLAYLFIYFRLKRTFCTSFHGDLIVSVPSEKHHLETGVTQMRKLAIRKLRNLLRVTDQ